MGPKLNRWTRVEDERLRKHYANIANERLVAIFPGRSLRAITNRANRFELLKSQERKAEMGRENQRGRPDRHLRAVAPQSAPPAPPSAA